MIRLVLFAVLFLFSFLTVYRAPTNLLWYVSILVTEFCWVLILLICLLLFFRFGDAKFYLASQIIGVAALAIFSIPIVQAIRLANQLPGKFQQAFPSVRLENIETPFNPVQMITGIAAKKVTFKSFTYDTGNKLSLDFYPAVEGGTRPCVIVVHGGSWAGGDSQQLPELNSEMAKWNYHVASINYRLAPKSLYPSPLEDVKNALTYLRLNAASLQIDTGNIVLLGRSAGGQIALSSAYTLHDESIKGVICFYGPADMVWGYENPTHPLVMDSRKIMRDYLGGSLEEQRDHYVTSSATETVDSLTPPTLMIFGENDPLVSHEHGWRLTKKLKAFNRPYFELYLPWATHGFDYTLNGPGGQLSTWTVKQFLEAITKK